MSSPLAPGAKRRRTSEPCWASLPEGLVGLVGSRLLAGGGGLLDYVRFRAVCTGWRSGAVSPRGRSVTDPRFHPHRWMMLPEGHGFRPGHPRLRGYAGFLNLDTGALVRVRVPLLKDHLAIDSVDGLLLLLGGKEQTGTVRLLHPFTGDILELPPLSTLLPQLGTLRPRCPLLYRIEKLCCASASFSAGVTTVMLAFDNVHRVAFATSLDREWSLSSWEHRASVKVAIQGKLYMMQTRYVFCDSIYQIVQIDPPAQDGASSGGTLQPPKLIATIPESEFVPNRVVECGSEILVVGYERYPRPLRILVYKLEDLVLRRFIPIRNIGDNTLFLGSQGQCMSVSSKVLSTVNGDNVVCIYRIEGKDCLAQFCISNGRWSPAIDDCSLYGNAPGPSSLIHYIFSSCTPNLWNRGAMFRMPPPGSRLHLHG